MLTFLPGGLFALMIALRVGEEEQAMVAQFGEVYEAYMDRTPRFLPTPGSLGVGVRRRLERSE